MKDKILKLSLLNHLHSLKWMLFSILIYYSIVLYLFKDSFIEKDSSILLVVHLWVIIPLIIVAYIHISYYFENKNYNFKIVTNSIFDITKNIKIDNSDIEKIIIHKSYALTAGRIPFFPFQHYKYCEVVFKDGKKIILTSLLQYNIDEYLKDNLKGVLFENNFSPLFEVSRLRSNK